MKRNDGEVTNAHTKQHTNGSTTMAGVQVILAEFPGQARLRQIPRYGHGFSFYHWN